MKLEKLLEQGVTKASGIYWGDPVYIIDTNLAPEDPKEFLRYARESIEWIMDDVKSESVVSDKFRVKISGDLCEKYVKTAERLGRKSYNQKRRVNGELLRIDVQPIVPGNKLFSQVVNIAVGGIVGECVGNQIGGLVSGLVYNDVSEGIGTRLVTQARSAMGFENTQLTESSRNSIKTMINTIAGGVIGYCLSQDAPVIGVTAGVFVGNLYNEIVQTVELPVRLIFKEVKRTTFDEFRLNRRYPLAKRADDYKRFGETIARGYVRTG